MMKKVIRLVDLSFDLTKACYNKWLKGVKTEYKSFLQC